MLAHWFDRIPSTLKSLGDDGGFTFSECPTFAILVRDHNLSLDQMKEFPTLEVYCYLAWRSLPYSTVQAIVLASEMVPCPVICCTRDVEFTVPAGAAVLGVWPCSTAGAPSPSVRMTMICDIRATPSMDPNRT